MSPRLTTEHGSELGLAFEEFEVTTLSLDSPSSTGNSVCESACPNLSLDHYARSSADSPLSSAASQDIQPDEELEDTWGGFESLHIPRSVASGERAVALTPSSSLLLQHYLNATSGLLVAKPLFNNPFVTLVLPLTFSDELLMHSVLALSGTHLSFKKGDDVDIQLATYKHYALLLQKLRVALTAHHFQDDVEKSLRLLLVLMVLCYVEVCLYCSEN